MKVTDKFRQMIRIIERMEKIEVKRQRHKDALAKLDAQLADLGVEWEDITKSLSDDVAMALPQSLVPNRALPERKTFANRGPNKGYRHPQTLKREEKILGILTNAKAPMSAAEIAKKSKYTKTQARLALRRLVEHDRVIKLGKTKKTTYKVK